MRILIVEDHVETASALHRLLLSVGCHCRTAHSCREASLIAAGEKFDLLLADIGLPDGTGCELLRELRTVYGLDGIALTGWNTPEVVESIAKAGFLSFLVKPIDYDELQLAIAQVKDRQQGR